MIEGSREQLREFVQRLAKVIEGPARSPRRTSSAGERMRDTVVSPDIRRRLEHLRRELRAERISYSELAELQALAPHIEPGDVELLEAAGVPEHEEDEELPEGEDRQQVGCTHDGRERD